MKTKVYLKIGKGLRSIIYKAEKRLNPQALRTSSYGAYLPTVCIALNIDIPDEMFKKAQAELDLKINKPQIASEIKVEEIKECSNDN